MRLTRIALALVAVVALGACGVEVPDDVAARAATTAPPTTGPAPSTTAPTSDDELEQALIDNGYTLDEARCGAERLRDDLDDDEVQEIIDAASIEDIDPRTAARFADALSACVEGGEDPAPSTTEEGDDPPPTTEDDPGRRGGPRSPSMPGMGDDGDGEVSRSRFLSALLAAGVPDDEARCLVDAVYEAFDPEVVSDIFHAPDVESLPDAVVDELDAITESCR